MENIVIICITWLNDPVYAIRESACRLMKKLYDIFKGEEFEKRLLEKLHEMKASNSYLIRNTVLLLAKEFALDEFDLDFVEKKLTPLIIRSAKDKTPNVRMNAAVILKKIYKHIKSKDISKEIQLVFEELKRDHDIDVVNALNDS